MVYNPPQPPAGYPFRHQQSEFPVTRSIAVIDNWRLQADELPASLKEPDNAALLKGILRGVEREGLRVTSEGSIAQTAHPAALGSALTHPHITTDFSEALLEFITAPTHSLPAMME